MMKNLAAELAENAEKGQIFEDVCELRVLSG